MKTPSLAFLLRTNHRQKDGRLGIYLRFTLHRKLHLISLGLSVGEKYWNTRKQRVNDAAPDSFNINTLLEVYQEKARGILLEYRINRRVLTFERFRQHFLDDHYASESFYDYVAGQIKVSAGVLGAGTLKGYRDQLNKLKDYRGSLTFSEIDHTFLRGYENFLATEREKVNNRNTINKSLSFLRTMLNRAKKDGLIQGHVFEQGAKVGRIEGDRQFLTLDELAVLEGLYQGNTLKRNQQEVLRYFLFACYTGLRYGDLRNLRHKDLENNKWIALKTEKTGEPVRIPLIPKAKALLPEKTFDNAPIFRVQTNQSSNRKLKEIMEVASINKTISMHCARHTFGTASLDLGIPLEVIQSILGHTDSKMTTIYAKIRDGLKEREMGKWHLFSGIHLETSTPSF